MLGSECGDVLVVVLLLLLELLLSVVLEGVLHVVEVVLVVADDGSHFGMDYMEVYLYR